MMKERVEWVDTAKGLCILLVVFTHAVNPFAIKYPLADVLITFRMPLYFILSGLFFKTYDGFVDFMIRKVNKLLIPYTFFFLLLCVFIPYVLYQCFDFTIWGYEHNGLQNLVYIYSENLTPNPAIWFLVCLFEVNILFYAVYLLSRKSKYPKVSLLVMVLAIGITGLLLALSGTNLPYYFDTALSVLPFFVFGWYIRRETDYLYLKKTKWYILIPSAILFAVIVHYINGGTAYFRLNSYGKLGGLVQLYPYGIAGTLLVFEFSRLIEKVPVISFVGRYSIIVLCIHMYVIQCIYMLLPSWNVNALWLCFLVFVAATMICALLIYPFKKYLAYFTAQKDLFPTPSKESKC